jgi:uncharacterized protein (DUF2249 family)
LERGGAFRCRGIEAFRVDLDDPRPEHCHNRLVHMMFERKTEGERMAIVSDRVAVMLGKRLQEFNNKNRLPANGSLFI